MSELAWRLAGGGTPYQPPGRDLVALQGLRWPLRTAHLPFNLETVVQIECGLCQAPGTPLPLPGPSPSQPAAHLHTQGRLQTPFSSGANLTPRTAPQVQERTGTVAPRDRWTEGNLPETPRLCEMHRRSSIQPNSGSCQADGRLHPLFSTLGFALLL